MTDTIAYRIAGRGQTPGAFLREEASQPPEDP